MDRVAVFVDAGYVFAQGSATLFGSKIQRDRLQLDTADILAELKEFASLKTGIPLLRIYWYDGAATYKGPSAQHTDLAHRDDVKIRLGLINSSGQQKGVDSMIVTDMVELARNRAISDAILLSGDEDVRIGVQLAQSYGVRIHLLGITPSRASQSKHLVQEADTTSEWPKETVLKFLKSRNGVESTQAAPIAVARSPIQTNKFIDEQSVTQPAESHVVTTNCAGASSDSNTLLEVVTEYLKGTGEADKTAIIQYVNENRGVPPEHDKHLLINARTRLGRDLEESEKRLIRRTFRQNLQKQDN